MTFWKRRGARQPSKHPLVKRMIIMLIALFVVFGGIFGFQIFKAQMIKQYFASNQAPPAVVSATIAQTQLWQAQIEAVGTLRAVRGIEVTTEVAGIVSSINFKSGDTVAAGKLLVQLSADTDLAQLRAAEAAAELAETAYKRAKEQFAVQAISRAALDSAAAETKSRRAQADQQRALAERKAIRAPFAGKLGISDISLGQYLNPGNRIVTLQTIDPILVDFTLPQQQLAQIVVGQTVALTTNVFPDRRFAGTINAVDPRVDPATRNVRVQATLANTGQELFPGMFATVTVSTGTPQQQLTLPQTAVSFNPYGSTVYILRDTGTKDAQGQTLYKAQQSFVETGATRGNQVAIVKGIKPGDLVVTAGQLKLRNDATAIVGKDVQTSGNPAPAVANR